MLLYTFSEKNNYSLEHFPIFWHDVSAFILLIFTNMCTFTGHVFLTYSSSIHPGEK